MKTTIDAAVKKLREKSRFYSKGFVENEITAESKTPAAKTRFVDNLAIFQSNTVCSQITRPLYLHRQAKAAKKETCVICFDNDIDSDLMFLVGKCGHRFCLNCVKQHMQVKLLDGNIPACPQHRCKSQLSIDSCVKLLNPKLFLIWEQRIKEDSIPLNEKVYCPFKSCSYLMSKTEVLSSPGYAQKICFKCGGSFCVYCKVPWHDSISCTDYKRYYADSQNVEDAQLKTLARYKGWRQCRKCQPVANLETIFTRGKSR